MLLVDLIRQDAHTATLWGDQGARVSAAMMLTWRRWWRRLIGSG